MMQKVFSISFLLICLSSNFSQAQTFEWAHTSGTNIIATGAAIAADEHGNCYVTGTFFGKCRFGDFELEARGRDIYIVKYDARGNALWAKRAGGSADDFGNAIALDHEGNCYLAGAFAEAIIFGNDTLKSKGQHDIFIAKYNSKGEVLWAKSAGGYYDDHAMALSLDKAGNCYVAGYFKDTMWMTPDSAVIGKRISTFDMFFAKYDSKGKFLWVKKIGGSNYSTQNEGLAMASDAKGITTITGYYQGEALFDKKKLTNRGGYALFVAKYDSDGKMIWAKSSDGERSSVIGKGIALDKKGNCYITGSYTASATFDTITTTSKNIGFPEIFLAKYNSGGDIVWLRSSGGFGEQSSYSAALDAEGDPYVLGTFRDTAIFGSLLLSGSGTQKMFLVKYSAAGKAQWAKQAGRHGMLLGKSLCVDEQGNVFMTGNYTDTAEFGKARLQAQSNAQDVFIAKLSPHEVVKENKLKEAPAADFTFISCTLDEKSRIATAKYSIPKASFVVLEVYDMMGNVAESFIEGQRDAGQYEVKLDLKNFKVDSEYYCRLECGKEKQTKKMELKK